MNKGLSAGSILHNRYLIERALEEGGMSSVYAAWDQSLGARVAVKEMKVFFTGDDQTRITEQFRLEASLLANLSHSGLPRVTNSFDERGTSYLVMDLIDGDSLGRLVDRYVETMPEGLVMMWAYEICEVLEYLHTRKPPIIFRDLKPSNVMITREGHVKIIDFGISKIFDQRREGATRTAVRGAGTPGFQPPEQYGAGGARRTDPRSDLYSLGATLYAVMTFQVPPEAVDRGLNNVPLVPVKELCRTISEPFATMIEKLMRLNPDERYNSAREVMRELQVMMGGVPPRDAVDLPPGAMKPPADGPSHEPPGSESPPAIAAPLTTPMPLAAEAATSEAPPTPAPAPAPPAPPPAPLHQQETQLAPDAATPATVAQTPAAPPSGSRGAVIGVAAGASVVVIALLVKLAVPSSTTTNPSPSPSTSAIVNSPTATTSTSPTAVSPPPTALPTAASGFQIVVDPPGMDLYVDGAIHPSLGTDGYHVPERAYPIKIKLRGTGFVPIDTEIDSSPGARKLYHMVRTSAIEFASPHHTATEVSIQAAHQALPSFGLTVEVPAQHHAMPWTVKDLPPGAYTYQFSGPGHVTKPFTVKLSPGQVAKETKDIPAVPVVAPPPPPCPRPACPRPYHAPPTHPIVPVPKPTGEC